MVQEYNAAGPPATGAPVVLRDWQAKALPVIIQALKDRKRAVVAAFMGAGKSYLIAELIRRSREQEGRGVVVLAPRTALVEQLSGTFGKVLGPVNVGQWWEAEKQADRRVTVSTYQSLPTLIEAWRKAGRSCSMLVCDEAHRTEAGVILSAVGSLEGLAAGRWLTRIGVTATPFRSDDKEALSLWDEVVYRYSYADAVRDGVVVPHKVIGWDGLEDENDTDLICYELLRKADRWPALASAKSIVDAEAFAVYLGQRGISAAAIHSQLSRKEQAARIYGLRSGAFRCLVHVSMLSEGSDFPWLRTLLLRRPVGARVRFVQEVGRVLRVDPENPEKVDGLILDPFDLMGAHGLRHKDALGRAMDGEEAVEVEEDGEGEAPDRAEKKRPAVRKTAVYAWLWSLCSALEEHGLELQVMASRTALATEKQVATIGDYLKILRWFPAEKAKERIRKWAKDGRLAQLTRREAGMLLSFLFWLSRATKEARVHGATTHDWETANKLFSWPLGVPIPDDIPELESEKLEAAAKAGRK
jgi:hypothetical protein